MTKPKYTPHPATVEAKRIRAVAMDKIRKMLAEQPMSTGAIAEALGSKSSTCYEYIKTMSIKNREIRRNGFADAQGRELWEITPEDERDEPIAHRSYAPKESAATAPRRVFAKARQMGMQRDEWVAAIFGPAGGVRE